MFAKAHEYKCGYVDQNGTKCDGETKLGELTQVRILNIFYNNLFYLFINIIFFI